jgi:hypothetical protein
VGHYPDEGDAFTIRAKVENKGNDIESGIVEFFAAGGDIKGEIKIGQASFINLQRFSQPMCILTGPTVRAENTALLQELQAVLQRKLQKMQQFK